MRLTPTGSTEVLGPWHNLSVASWDPGADDAVVPCPYEAGPTVRPACSECWDYRCRLSDTLDLATKAHFSP